jgi:putative ABC transport system permease protein
MLRLLLAQIRHRPSRPVALAAGIVVAAVSFVLLTSAAKTTEVRVRGSVESNFRAAYDILVRPRGSSTELETRERLVRPNYLSGIFGGITLDQYEAIKRVRDVEVAAPIANIGFVMPFGGIPFDLTRLMTKDPFQLYRVDFTWIGHRGTSRYRDSPYYLYFNRRHRFRLSVGFSAGGEIVPGASEPLAIGTGFYTSGPLIYGPFDRQAANLAIYSARTPAWNREQWAQSNGYLGPNRIGVVQDGFFPIFVSAVDPVEEAKLVRLDRALVSGRYLRGGDRLGLVTYDAKPARGLPRAFQSDKSARWAIPVIASTRSYVDEILEASVERLRTPAVDVPRQLASSDSYGFLTSLRGERVERRHFSLRPAYPRMLAGPRGSGWHRTNELQSFNFWTGSSTRYRQRADDVLEPIPTKNPISIWRNSCCPTNGGFINAAPSNQDLQFRRLTGHSGSNRIGAKGAVRTPVMLIVGRFDPMRLREFSLLSRVPLETYYPPFVEPADEASRTALGGRSMLPTQNVGDYVQPPPLVLTTLAGMKAFFNPVFFSGTKELARAPVSVVRVRVRGVRGPDELSQARIRRVAIAIRERTGLDVDITAGSSPHPLPVRLPPGKFGRPALTVREGWSKKGVSVSFLRALDDKRLALFALILLTCGFFLANGAFAVTRARRREIGTLLCLGWSQRAIFAVVLGEVALIGLVAGIAGAIVALAIAAVFSLDVPLWRSLLVVPVSVALALVAGLVPAWRASRSVPLDAVRPIVAGDVHGVRVRRLTTLALANLRRVPARSLVAVAGLFVGVAALTLLVAVNRAFQGTLVGTLLGEAISLQVRGLDFVSVGLVVGLAAMAVADVLFINLRERAAEFVTLRTLGWRNAHLRRVIALEALWLSLIGSIAGAVFGIVLGIQLAVPIGWLAVAAIAGVGGGIIVALAASVLPLSKLSALTPSSVLADE